MGLLVVTQLQKYTNTQIHRYTGKNTQWPTWPDREVLSFSAYYSAREICRLPDYLIAQPTRPTDRASKTIIVKGHHNRQPRLITFTISMHKTEVASNPHNLAAKFDSKCQIIAWLFFQSTLAIWFIFFCATGWASMHVSILKSRGYTPGSLEWGEGYPASQSPHQQHPCVHMCYM